MLSNPGTKPTFVVLYTHQKTKKSKIWHDGKLKVNLQDNKAELYDDKNTSIDTLYIKPAQVYIGADLESAKYLITVDDVKVEDGGTNVQTIPRREDIVQTAQPKFVKTFKRKRMDFIAPRQMNKTPDIGSKGSPLETPVEGGQKSKHGPLFTTPFSTVHHQGFSTSDTSVGNNQPSLQQIDKHFHSNSHSNKNSGCRTDNMLSSKKIFKNFDFKSKNNNLMYDHHTSQEQNLVSKNYKAQTENENHQKVIPFNISNEPVNSGYIDTDIPCQADLTGICCDSLDYSKKVTQNIYQPSYKITSDVEGDFENEECETNTHSRPGLKRNRAQILELLSNKKKKFHVPLKQSDGICSDVKTIDDNSWKVTECDVNHMKVVDMLDAYEGTVILSPHQNDFYLARKQELKEREKFIEKNFFRKKDKGLTFSNLGKNLEVFDIEHRIADIEDINEEVSYENQKEHKNNISIRFDRTEQRIIKSVYRKEVCCSELNETGKEVDKHQMDSGISRKECIILSSREGKSVLNEDDQLTTDAKLMLEEDGQLVLDDRGYAVSDEDVVSEGVKSILEKDSPSILKDVEIVIEEYNGNVASEEEDTGISEEDKKFRADEGKFIISKEDIKLISKKNVLEKANEDGQLMTKEDNLVISKEVGKIFREKDSCTVSAEVGKFISEDYGHVVSEEVDTIMLEENGNITSEKDCTFISEEDRKLMSKKALAISEVGKMQTKNYGCLVSGDVGKLMSEECGHTVPEGVSTIILGENGNVTSEKDGMNLISNKDDLGNVTSEKDGMNLISNKDDLNIALNKNSKLMSEKDVGKLVSEKDIYSVSEDVDTIMLEGNECITSEEYGNLTPEEEGLVTEDIGKLKTKEDSFGVLEEVGKLRLEENGNIVSEEKAISFEALHITLEDSSLLSEKINVSENRKQRVVEQSFEKNKHFENDVMEVGGHDLDWNADSNQHQVSSVNSSQETVTSADTFDFPVCSPLSRKWAMIESPDIKHDHPSQERFSDYTISDSGESEGGNVSQSSSFDDIIQNEEAEWKEICDIGQEPLRVSRKRTVTFQEDTDHVNWRIEPTDKNDSAKDSTISSVPAKKLHICSPFMNTEIYNTTVATISQVPPQTFNRYEVLFPVEEKVSATLPATTPHCSAFTMNDYKRNNKSGVLLLDVTSKKIDGYRWKGTKCSETAKRSLPLNNSHQPSSDCYNSTPEDERLIYQLETGNQNDSLDNLESCLLQPASNVALCHSEPQLSMFKSPFMNNFSECLHGNENFSSHCVQEDKLSYGCSRHNTDQSRNVVPLQKGSKSVSEFMENSIDKCKLIQHEGQYRNPIIDLDYNLNSEPLMINNTKAHYDVQPVNVSSHPMNDGACEPYMKIPDSDSDFSYLSQNDDNLLYDVVDVSKYSRAAISEPLISEEEQGGGNQVHQRVPVDGRFALEQFEKCTPSFCQEVPSFSTVNIAIPNDKDTYDRHTGNSQLPLFSTEEDADRSLCNPSTHSRVVSHYFEYVGCDQENNQRAEIWKFNNNSSSRRYENNMDIGLSTRLRKPLISRPPDVEVQSNIRSLHMAMTTSETGLQERSGHLIGIDRTRNNTVCVLRQEKEDNVAATNLNETSRDITLTLDQSLTDELGEFFGSDVKEVFNTLYENSEKSLSVQEPTPTLTKIQTEMFESQENSEVHSQNTLYVSGETENHVKSLVQLEDCRNSTKLRVKEKTNSYGVERNRAIPCIRTVELVKKSEKKAFCSPLRSSQMFGSKLRFPSKEEVDGGPAPTRQAVIPVIFEGVKVYKETLTSAIREHLNILLFRLSQRYHQALSRVDISGLIPGSDGQKAGTDTGAPVCQHNTVAKMICVKKDGPNKGRFFYTCSQPRTSQCKFFLWADQYKPDKETEDCKTSSFAPKLSTAMQIRNYMKGLGLALHCRCQLIRKASGGFNQPNLPTWIKKYRKNMEDNVQKKLFLKLTYKEVSSTYAKDDLWVISSSLQFDPACSFIAKSIYHGPSSNMEIQIEPVSGYSPSNWTAGTVHSLLLVNASNELAQLANIEEHVTLNTVPILPYLMDSSYNPDNNRQMSSKAFKSPICSTPRLHTVPCTSHEIEMLANEFIDNYHLNADQAEALLQVASMFNSVDNSKRRALPITLIHGVFGAGKSFLLSVVVLFLVHLFTIKTDQLETSEDDYWKLLISSTTNVAVDRILMGLLDLGFEDFIRVGSLRKISKPILPYSVHASDKKNDDIKELQEMLKSDLTPSEKQLIKKSLERQRLGHNKALLAKVKVVAVTCAACAFPCIDKLKFPVVLLDECSQMTEPASLLPIAKFHSEKLVLVGDPKQLPPTIQGSEAATTYGLEQTLFGRLVIMGIEAVMLRTQYRCHPHISALSNQLFYDNQLVDGVNTEQRQQLMKDLPTLCFYNVHEGQEQCDSSGSYYNLQEVRFIAFLLQVVLHNGVNASEIGVITLYRAQAFKIAEFLKTEIKLKPEDVRRIQISTVDAFQGGEKNVVLLSCVRTDYVGFIDSYKRTNVALTRSKFHLFIIGHLRILSQNQLWGLIINLCKDYPHGIQSAKQFIKKWKDKSIDATKTKSQVGESLIGKEAAKRSASDIIDITAETIYPTEEQNFTENNQGEVNDKPITPAINVNEWNIPIDSQGSPSYSPLEEIQAHGSDASPEHSLHVDRPYGSPSYSPLMETQSSGSDSDLPNLEF